MSQLVRQIIILSLCLIAALVAKSYVNKMLEGPATETATTELDSEVDPTAGLAPEVSVEAAVGPVAGN